MIVSCSRRTDIPAFYAGWFINRIRAGYCTVPNPFNREQVAQISLRPEDVDVIVFWTRNPRPLFPYLAELDERSYRYYFQYTLLDHPRQIDPKTPSVGTSLKTFRELAERIGPWRVVWRYDPVVFTSLTPASFHRQAYNRIAGALGGYTHRSVISLMDVYSKAKRRLFEMGRQGAALLPNPPETSEWFPDLMHGLAQVAGANGMELVSCAETRDLQPYGIRPGKCIDDGYIARVFGLVDITHQKDPGQRAACGCVASRDIGMYDSCLFGCQYCYATSSFETAKANYARYDPSSPSLLGWYDPIKK